jgi:hypothetical protein
MADLPGALKGERIKVPGSSVISVCSSTAGGDKIELRDSGIEEFFLRHLLREFVFQNSLKTLLSVEVCAGLLLI